VDPVTVAVNCWLAPAGSVTEVGVIVMATVVLEEVSEDPPHPATSNENKTATIEKNDARFN
jgi:hypothetical protein